MSESLIKQIALMTLIERKIKISWLSKNARIMKINGSGNRICVILKSVESAMLTIVRVDGGGDCGGRGEKSK